MFSLGSWKNIMEMEDTLTLDELYLLVDAMYRKEERHNRFMAAIQGIDLSENDSNPKFDDVQRRVEAELAGKSEEEYVFDLIGIEVDADDD